MDFIYAMERACGAVRCVLCVARGVMRTAQWPKWVLGDVSVPLRLDWTYDH